MPSSLRFGLVVLLVAGAGCTFLAPTAPNTASSTATAAPVPTPPPTPPPLPPGVEPPGVVDHVALAAAHRTSLLNTNYTRTVTESTRRPNGSVIWQRTRVIKINGAQVFAVINQSGDSVLRDTALKADHVELYTRMQRAPNESAVSAAVTHNGRTDYQRTKRYRRLLDDRGALRQLLAVFETRIVSRNQRDGTMLFRLEATGPPVVDRFQFVPARRGVSDPRNITFQLLVDEQGIVHRYRLAYTATVDGQALRYERTVRLSVIGSTTVHSPAWLARVNSTTTPTNTPTPTLTASEDSA